MGEVNDSSELVTIPTMSEVNYSSEQYLCDLMFRPDGREIEKWCKENLSPDTYTIGEYGRYDPKAAAWFKLRWM